jgi:hypothetical protein
MKIILSYEVGLSENQIPAPKINSTEIVRRVRPPGLSSRLFRAPSQCRDERACGRSHLKN